MNGPQRLVIPPQLQVLASLAQLLQKLEAEPGLVGAEQYRRVATALRDELATAAPGPVLDALLGLLPAAAELYENLQYGHAGLCRSPLEKSLNAELQASQAIRRAAARPTEGASDGSAA